LIAWKESTFHPFYLETLYGIWALWPYESFATSSQPAGYNIGLMMPTLSNKYVGSMATAWDWTQNATAGADTFASKVTLAVNEIQTLAYWNKKLSAITASELEDIAMGFYSGNASLTDTSTWPWVPSCFAGLGTNCYGGSWTWTENTTNSASTYVNKVRNPSTALPSC